MQAANSEKSEIVLRWKPRELSETEFSFLPETEQPYVTHTEGKILLMGKPEKI